MAGEPEWGCDDSDRPVVLVAHGGLIAALTAALLDLPVENWPVLGGMGNASWAQLCGARWRGRRGVRRTALAAGRLERIRSGRQRCPLRLPLSRIARPCWYSPIRCPTTDRRAACPLTTRVSGPISLLPNIGWDLELIGRIGWTSRDVWWAATQDPRSWAALPRAGAVIFATSGMDSLPSPFPPRCGRRSATCGHPGCAVGSATDTGGSNRGFPRCHARPYLRA